MSRWLVFLLFLLVGGCAPVHYVHQDDLVATFVLRDKNAKKVQFASSADSFVVHDVTQFKLGIWQIGIKVDTEIRYFYLVDGQIHVPACRLKEYDDFGSENCLYVLD